MAAWACPQCTFENHPELPTCEVCGTPRPGAVDVHYVAVPSAPIASPLPTASAPPADVCDTAAIAATAPPLDGAGYHQAVPSADLAAAPSAPTAPAASAAPVFDAEELARCTWLVSEALNLESRAAELDSAGSSAEALFHHRRATVKLEEAIDACPDEHPDKAKLDEHLADIRLRMVYLEGCGSAAPSVPLEEHVAPIELTMDLSSAKAPEQEVQDVAGLVAATGASGSTAATTEDGYQLVAALKKNDEMRVFIGRVLEAAGRRVRPGAEAELEGLLPEFSGQRQVQSLARLQEALMKCPWAELILDPKQDKLKLAMDLEKEARRFESLELRGPAVDMYNRSVAILQFVMNRDDRMKNPKIKEMVGQRLADLQVRVAEVQLKS